jgi:hypothetical protein
VSGIKSEKEVCMIAQTLRYRADRKDRSSIKRWIKRVRIKLKNPELRPSEVICLKHKLQFLCIYEYRMDDDAKFKLTLYEEVSDLYRRNSPIDKSTIAETQELIDASKVSKVAVDAKAKYDIQARAAKKKKRLSDTKYSQRQAALHSYKPQDTTPVMLIGSNEHSPISKAKQLALDAVENRKRNTILRSLIGDGGYQKVLDRKVHVEVVTEKVDWENSSLCSVEAYKKKKKFEDRIKARMQTKTKKEIKAWAKNLFDYIKVKIPIDMEEMMITGVADAERVGMYLLSNIKEAKDYNAV